MSFLAAQTPSLVQASDGVALTMLVLIAFSLGIILTILVVMARDAGKKPDLNLPEENPPPKHPAKKGPDGDTPQDWEREADWWKQS